MRNVRTLMGFMVTGAVAVAAQAAVTFTPAAGYAADAVWTGNGAAHFALAADAFYTAGVVASGAGQEQLVIQQFDGSATTPIAASATFSPGAYYADAVTAVPTASGVAVYWVQAQSFGAGGYSNLYRTAFDGGMWTTTKLIDESEHVTLYSLSSSGGHVLGTSLMPGGANAAFFLDGADDLQTFAQLPALASGGSGFAPNGDFFAGAFGDDFVSRMYEFSAAQVAARLSGAQATPYAASDALAAHAVLNNASAVMESDGTWLYGSNYNATFTGSNPYAHELGSGSAVPLGTLGGAPTTVATDFYARDGVVYFLGKDDFATGGQATIFALTPEPTACIALCLLAAVAGRRR